MLTVCCPVRHNWKCTCLCRSYWVGLFCGIWASLCIFIFSWLNWLGWIGGKSLVSASCVF